MRLIHHHVILHKIFCWNLFIKLQKMKTASGHHHQGGFMISMTFKSFEWATYIMCDTHLVTKLSFVFSPQKVSILSCGFFPKHDFEVWDSNKQRSESWLSNWPSWKFKKFHWCIGFCSNFPDLIDKYLAGFTFTPFVLKSILTILRACENEMVQVWKLHSMKKQRRSNTLKVKMFCRREGTLVQRRRRSPSRLLHKDLIWLTMQDTWLAFCGWIFGQNSALAKSLLTSWQL